MEQQRFDPVEAMAQMRHEFGEHGGVNMSVEASTAFTVLRAERMPEIFQGRAGPDAGCYLYGRHFNPTVYVLGRQLAAMEMAEAGYCTASGMAAIAAVLLQLCGHGGHLVASRTIYGGTFALLSEYLPAKAGIRTTFVDITDEAEVEAAFAADTRLMYVETIGNPTLVVADLPRLADIAHRHGVPLVVDNTFAPLIVTPIAQGADIVIHSLTKFINGASDIVAGAICGRTEFIQQLMDLHTGSLMLLGPTMDPHQAYAISLRLPHLHLRMREHSARAALFAERIAERGYPVRYPGLPGTRDRAVLERIARPEYGFGGLLCVDLTTRERAFRFMEILQNEHRFGFMAVSLGYFETLMSCSAASTSSEMPEDEQRRAGIAPGMVRISVGLTGSVEQRWRQLAAALDVLGPNP